MNVQVLSVLTSYYHNTLRSIVWVDSRGIDEKSTLQWSLTHQEEAVDNEPDPLVMVAWLCPNLEEVVLLG